MFNLLFQEEKENVRREYRRRLIVVSLWFLLAALLLGLILLFPSYFISASYEKKISAEYKAVKDSLRSENYEQLDSLLRETGKKLKILSPRKNIHYFHDVIAGLLRNRSSNIKISRITFRSGGENGGEAQIIGTANKREDLLSFNRSLEREKMFSKVELPISSFAKDTDISFSIKINGSF